MRWRKRMLLVIVAIIIVKFMWNSTALVGISLGDEKIEREHIETVSPEAVKTKGVVQGSKSPKSMPEARAFAKNRSPRAEERSKYSLKSALKSPLPQKLAKLPEPTLVPWLNKIKDTIKSRNEDSAGKLYQKAPYKDILEKIAMQHSQNMAFRTHMDMKSLNVYYRSPPSCIKRREILRDYVAMWKMDISDPSIENFVSPRIIFFTAETPDTEIEAKNNKDLILIKYDAIFNNVKCEEGIFDDNKNDSRLYDEEMFEKSLKYAAKDEFAGPEVGHLFLKDTDLVNFDTIRNVSRQIGDETDEAQAILCFGKIERSHATTLNPAYCGAKIFMRGDTTQKLMIPEYSVPHGNFDIAEVITGKQRERAGIHGIVMNMKPQATKAVVTLPYLDWDYAHFRKHFYEWAMDIQPPDKMTYDLPDLYLQDRPVSDRWTVGLLEAPPCTASYTVMSLIKTARKNGLIRKFIRMYHKFQEKLQPPNQNPYFHKLHVPVRFILGKGDSNEDPELTKNVTQEIKENGDIIVGDFIDSYENLPLKTLTGYEYIKNVCAGSNTPEYFMFHDDDTMIQFSHLEDYLKTEPRHLSCLAFKGSHARPFRWGKYNVTTDQWASGHWLPEFCTGPCNLMSRQTALKILEAAEKTDPKGFKLEDVLFTGIIRIKAGLPAPDQAPKNICNVGDGLKFITSSVNRYVNANKQMINKSRKLPWTDLASKMKYFRENIFGDLIEYLPEYQAFKLKTGS